GIVWTRSASVGDSDLYVFRAAADFRGSTLFATEISTIANSVEPTVAGSWVDNSMTVAWARLASFADRCWAKSFQASAPSGSLANPVLLTGAGASERRPRAAASKLYTAGSP